MGNEYIESDVLVVGAGSAGIMAAIRAQEEGANVLLTTSGLLGKDSAVTWMTGGGFECALYPPDSPMIHTKDTIRNGSYLSNQELVYTMLSEAPGCIMDLDKWGVKFWKQGEKFIQDFLPGHTYARCLMREREKAVGRFGGEHRRVLPHQVRIRGIKTIEDFLVTDLLTADGRVAGAVGIDIREGEFRVLPAKAVILATGGYSSCFKRSLTGPWITGWGHGMAYRAGAEFIDMEILDFYPYCPVWPKGVRTTGDWGAIPRYGLSGKFYNKSGFEFWESYRARGRTRAQAIYMEVKAGRGSPHGGVYLSFRHLPVNIIEEFLNTWGGWKWCQQMLDTGIDIRNEAIELFPSAMSTLGGCRTGLDCQTNVPGLYAIGELASGLDGAHTLAGNLMIFCFTTGSVAGREAARQAKRVPKFNPDEEQVEALQRKVYAPLERREGISGRMVKTEIKDIMWEYCNVAGRTKEGLGIAIQQIEKIKTEKLPQVYASAKNRRFNLEWGESIEVENMVVVAELTLRSALTRTESRGLHSREDYPRLDPNWVKNIVIKRDGEVMSIRTEPITFPYLQPNLEVRADV